MRKLTKLSLVAAVAVAGLTTSASAVALEEAIKGVDVSGYVRYRMTETTTENAWSNQENEYKIVTAVKIPVDDNMKVGIKLLAKGTTLDEEQGTNLGNDADPELTVANAYFAATIGKTSLTLGKQDIKTPITDEARGTGILAINTDTPVTLAAAAFTNSKGDSTMSSTNNALLAPENIYALAAIGSMGPVNAQGWLFAIENVVDSLFFVEASGKIEMVTLTAQYATAEYDDRTALANTDQSFFGLEAAATFNNIDLSIGYNCTDEEGGAVSLDGTDAAYVGAGEQVAYVGDVTGTAADASYFYATVSAPVMNGITLGADYIGGETANVDDSELVLRAAYAYNKKLKFSTYYSMYETDAAAGGDTDKMRIEAKYSF
jgi:hypothetical protein